MSFSNLKSRFKHESIIRKHYIMESSVIVEQMKIFFWICSQINLNKIILSLLLLLFGI